MQVKFDLKYERSRKKVSKRIEIQKIEQTESLFQTDPTHHKLELKSIMTKDC